MEVKATLQKVAVVVGIGPGLGAAVARRFARGGYAVALLARSQQNLDPVANDIKKLGGMALSIPTDATDEASVAAAFETIRTSLGDPVVAVYNAGAFKFGGLLSFTPAEFERIWKANCFGGLLLLQQVIPGMKRLGGGAVLLTGATASLRGSANFANLAVGKFGLRALAQSAAREFHPQGIHVAHVIVDGQILTDPSKITNERPASTFLNPDAMAETYWHLAHQDKTVWTHELELRPNVEKF